MKKNVTVGRLLVLFLAIAMLSAGLFAGCTKEADETEPTQPITTEEKQTEATAEAEEQEPDMASMEETLDIIWWGYNVPGYLPTNNSYMKSFLEDKYNITIEDLMVDLGNKEQVNIMLATGVDFDVRTQNQDFASIHELGLVRSIPEEYIINYAPALYEPLFEEAGEDWKLYATIDGEIFGVPALSYTFLAPVVMGLRTDWIEAVGYDPENLPTTLEGLEELLTKFRTDDPDGNGVQDTYALSKFDDYDPYVFGAYGISDRYWYNDEAGNPVYYATDEKYKEVLKVLQRWYAEGIFDPEVVTDGRTEVQVKFVADKLAGYYGNEWAFTEGHNLSPLKKAKDEGKEIGVTIVPPVSLDAGSEAATLHYSLGLNTNGMVFGVNCTDEKLVRILQIENDMFTDMELLRLSFFGQEGYSYTLNEDGTVNTTDAYKQRVCHKLWPAKIFVLRILAKEYPAVPYAKRQAG